jgi:hypothetical protein
LQGYGVAFGVKRCNLRRDSLKKDWQHVQISHTVASDS